MVVGSARQARPPAANGADRRKGKQIRPGGQNGLIFIANPLASLDGFDAGRKLVADGPAAGCHSILAGTALAS